MGDVVGTSTKSLFSKSRIIALAALIVLFFFIILSYLFFLQVVSSPVYKQRAKEVATHVTTISARRGEIFDRNYDQALALNVDSFAVDIIPAEIPRDQIDTLFAKLALFLKMEKEDIAGKIKEKHYQNFSPFMVKTGVLRETVYRLVERIEEYPGVTWHSKPKRSYPTDGSLAHILGYVNTMTIEEFQILYNKGYSYDAVVGKRGIEQYYEDVLRGEDGKRLHTVDVKGKQTQESFEEVPPVPGKNIVLTIDRRIQKLSERALGNRSGSVLVLKPETGEILALVSYPWYDANIFTSSEKLDRYNEMALDPQSPFLNRAVQSVYPPASLFKIIMTTANVEDGVFPQDETVECRGELRVGDKVFSCWKKTGHGRLSLMGALAHSCNIYFWTLGLRHLGHERILRFAREFGLGEKTGIDFPGEAEGFLPSPDWKEQRENQPWVGGDTMNLSIGQGWTLVTPLQVANMVALVVNRGVVYKPHLVKEIRDPETGRVISEIERDILRKTYIRSETFETVQRAMREVVISGTGRIITTKAVVPAAKTGTSETAVENSFHSWFVGYAPYITDVPEERVIVVVMVEATEEDYEWWAPKAANAIFQGIFADQTYDEAADTLNLWYLKQNQ
jgi:penicillin-binding protein 2